LGFDPSISKENADHRTIHVASSGLLTGSFAEVFFQVLSSLGGEIVMRYSAAPWHTEAKRVENSKGICQPPPSCCAPGSPDGRWNRRAIG